MADDDDDLDAGEEESLAEPKRRARLSILTIVLIFLNWIAAGAFVYLLFMDYRVRQEWSYGVFRNYLAMRGLPLEDEEQSPAFHEALPRLRLDPEIQKDVFGKRGGRVSQAFAAVDEPSPFQILPSHMTEEVQKDYFQGEPPVATLNDEVKRLKTTVPAAISKAAESAAATLDSDDKKAQAIEATLLPLAWDVYQVEKLHLKVKAAREAKDLDSLVSEALQRRIYADILMPLNLNRPGGAGLGVEDGKVAVDVEKLMVEKIANLDGYKIEQYRALLEKRIDAAIAAKYDPEVNYGQLWQGASDRDSIEKRHQVAFLLFALSQLHYPGDKTLVFPKGLERAEKVSGLFEFAIACQAYVQTVRVREDRAVEAIKNDREGHLANTKEGTPTRSAGFADRYGAEVLRLQQVVTDIDLVQKRLDDAQEQLKRFQKVLGDRQKHQQMIVDKLKDARLETAAKLKDVRELQRQLFEAHKTLADAADRNFKLEEDIHVWERRVKEGR
jgi:hypothetical protein